MNENNKNKEFDVFYFTFGTGHLKNYNLPVTSDKIILVIPSENENKARELVFKYIGKYFCTSYQEDVFLDIHDITNYVLIELDDLLGMRKPLSNGLIIEGIDNRFILNQILDQMRLEEVEFILTREDEGYNGTFVYLKKEQYYYELSPDELILFNTMGIQRPKTYTIMPEYNYNRGFTKIMDRIHKGIMHHGA